MKEKDYAIRWFNTCFYPKYRKARAVLYEERILPRLREQEITFFTPWGPRYNWQERGLEIKKADKELKAIRLLTAILNHFQVNMPGKVFKWIFLGADLYGVKINKLPVEVVQAYFLNLENILRQLLPGSEFILWSEFEQDVEQYRAEVGKNFRKYITPEVMERAKKTSEQIENAGDWKRYLVERVAEAMFMEDIFRPIKISCAPRYKDDIVDYELPRLYFVPERLHAPWL